MTWPTAAAPRAMTTLRRWGRTADPSCRNQPLSLVVSLISVGEGTVPAMTDSKDVVTVERLIPAPAAKIFDLIADPSRHQEIDGSGTVRSAKGGSERVALGSTFGMSMKMGMPYSMQNKVIEFEENRLVAWQTRGPGKIGGLVGGRIWRYELEEVDGGTLVKESWDISQESAFTKPVVKMGADATRKNMAATLERIEKALA